MGKESSLYLGVEIGGTKLQAGLGTADGKLTQTMQVAAQAEGGREAICLQIVQLVGELFVRAGIGADVVAGIGVGFGGPVDTETGTVRKSHQVRGWEGFPLARWFREQFSLPVALNNDSDLAGLAEAKIGAGRGFSPVVYMNIGSGIGGAIVIDGNLYSGQGKGSAEIGHLQIRPPVFGLEWPTLESLASGWSMTHIARDRVDQFPASEWAKKPSITTEELVAAVRDGDPLAESVWSEAVGNLAVAVANVITLLHPERYIIGGGVALAGDTLFYPLRQEVDRHVFAPFLGSFEIVPAELAQRVVLHGAILWAARQLDGDCE